MRWFFFVDKQLWTEFVYKPFGHALKVNNENRQVLGRLNLKPWTIIQESPRKKNTCGDGRNLVSKQQPIFFAF